MWVLKARVIWMTTKYYSVFTVHGVLLACHCTIQLLQTDWQMLLLCHCDVNFTGMQLLCVICICKFLFPLKAVLVLQKRFSGHPYLQLNCSLNTVRCTQKSFQTKKSQTTQIGVKKSFASLVFISGTKCTCNFPMALSWDIQQPSRDISGVYR